MPGSRKTSNVSKASSRARPADLKSTYGQCPEERDGRWREAVESGGELRSERGRLTREMQREVLSVQPKDASRVRSDASGFLLQMVEAEKEVRRGRPSSARRQGSGVAEAADASRRRFPGSAAATRASASARRGERAPFVNEVNGAKATRET